MVISVAIIETNNASKLMRTIKNIRTSQSLSKKQRCPYIIYQSRQSANKGFILQYPASQYA